MFYIILIILLLYLILRGIFKIKFHFWSVQPVFHIYDLQHWFNPYKVIETDLPTINKYVNIIDIRTYSINEISDLDTTKFCNFLKNNYLRNKRAEYLPDQRHIMEYLKSTNKPSFISIYRKPKILYTGSKNINNVIINDHEICSVISAKVLNITFKNKKTFPLYYIDNLCVNPDMRKQGIAPKSIQTLYYNIRRKNPEINTYLFKREGEMNVIVPLTTYYSKCYDVDKLPILNFLHASMKVIEISKQNINLFMNFLTEKKELLECIIVPDLTNILNIINVENVILYGIIENNKLIALYVYRDSATTYDEGYSLELINSLSLCHDRYSFICGLSESLNMCVKKMNKKKVNITKLLIEEIGDNKIFTKYLEENYINYLFKSPCAFFLYNYVSYTYASDKCFFLY
jgi:hypothetical protein